MTVFRDSFDKASMNGGEATVALNIPQNVNEEDIKIIDLQSTDENVYAMSASNRSNQGSSVHSYIQPNYNNDYKPQTSGPLPRAPKFEVSEGKRHSIPELATEKQFSEDFMEYVGCKNLQKLYFLNDKDQIEVLALIVENEGTVCRDKIEQILEYIKYTYQYNFRYTWNHTTLEWQLNGQSGQGICSLISLFYNQSYHLAVLKLAKMIGISRENCFNTFPLVKCTNTYSAYSSKCDVSLIPLYLHLKDELFALKSIIEIKDLAGNVISGTCKYTSENRTIFLPATIMQNGELAGCMCIGHTSPVAYLLNRYQINQYPNSVVLLPMNIMVSLELNELVGGSKEIKEQDVVVTGYYDSINTSLHVELDDLFGHDVILVPDINRQSMKTVIELANRCIKAGAQSVRIYPYPLLTFSANLNSDIISSISDPWERALLQHTVVLDEVERPSYLIQKIQRLAMSIDDYIACGKKNGLFKGDELEEDNCYGHDLPMDLVIIESA